MEESTPLPADEVKRLLNSEKITERKKGFTECSLLLRLDKENLVVSSHDWASICLAAINYERREMQHARAKSKPMHVEHAQFLRRLVKHCVSQSQISLKALSSLLHHVLHLLMKPEDLPAAYLLEHKQTLSSLLDLKVAHFLTTAEIVSVAAYLRDDAMVDKRGLVDPHCQKLLRSVCKALFSEHCAALAAELAEWICRGGGLFDKVQGDPDKEAVVTMLVADCLTLLIDYHGSTLAEGLFACVRAPLQMAVKLLSRTAQTNRDAHRESCLRFLLTYLHFSTACHYSLASPLCSKDPVLHVLPELFAELASDECLRTLVMHATNVSMRQNKDLFINVLDDCRFRLHFEVAAVSLCLLQLLTRPSVASLLGGGDDDTAHQRDEAASQAKRQKMSHSPNPNQKMSHSAGPQAPPLHGTVHVQGQGQGQGQGKANSSHDGGPAGERPAQALLRRLQGLCVTTARPGRGGPKAAQAGRPATQHGSALTHAHAQHHHPPPSHTQTLERQPAAAASGSRMAASVVYEGMLWLAAALARLFPRGEFLLPDTDCAPDILSRAARITALSEWVRALRIKAAEVLPADEMQIHGAMLVALRAFARVSAVVLTSQLECALPNSFCHDDTAATAASLRWEWGEVVSMLVHSPRVQSYCVGCKKSSIAEALYGLLETVLDLSLLDPSGLTAFQQALWGMPTMLDPRLVESPACLSLLAVLVGSQQEMAPSLGRDYLQQLQQADSEAIAAEREDEGAPVARAHMAELLTLDLQVCLPMLILACR